MISVPGVVEGVDLRPLTLDDARELAAAYRRNRAHLERWEPKRSEDFFTEAFQTEAITLRVSASEAGTGYSLGLFEGSTIIGRFNVAGIVRGAFQSASVGYWVDHQRTGKGLATKTIEAIAGAARDDLGLHRLEASVLPDNVASQRVLSKAGFQQIGMAPQYLRIAGRWQDHNLYQRILHA